MAHYQTLRAWQIAHQLAVAIAKVARRFPAYERFELASQLRRASLSVPTNLVEGRARFGPREYLRSVRIAASSLAEVDYLLYFARDVEYLSPDDYARLEGLRRHTNCLVGRLVRSLTKVTSPPIAVRRPSSPW